MAIIGSFLCWLNTRTGSVICGYYSMIISMMCIVFYMLKYITFDEHWDSLELKCLVYGGILLYSLMIGVSLILVAGVYMDRKLLLLPWIYVLVLTVLYESGANALITTIHLDQNHTLGLWEIIALTFYGIRLVTNCYNFACVVSQYQELSEGRGTYEFLYKPEMARASSLPDIDDYQPPFGAALPPYSQENPNKEYSPPNYENLSTDYEDIDNFTEQQETDTHAASKILNSEISSAFMAAEDLKKVNYYFLSEIIKYSDDSFTYSDISYPDIDYPEFNCHDSSCHKVGEIDCPDLNYSSSKNLEQCKQKDNLSEYSSSSFHETSLKCNETDSLSKDGNSLDNRERNLLKDLHLTNTFFTKTSTLTNELSNPSPEQLSIPPIQTNNLSRNLGNSYKKLSHFKTINKISPTSRHPKNLALDSDAVAMTISSNCLNYTTNSTNFQSVRCNHLDRTNFEAISPLVFKKKTYITWI